MSGESVRVAVRVRPLLGQLGEDCCVVQRGQPTVVVGGGENTTFTFDHAFGSDAAQHDIYCESAERLVDSFFDGFNATILAYGQTGSGKVRRNVEGVTRRPHATTTSPRWRRLAPPGLRVARRVRERRAATRSSIRSADRERPSVHYCPTLREREREREADEADN